MVSKSLGGVGGTTRLPDADIPFSGLERTIVTQNGNSRGVAVAVLMAGNGGGDGTDISTRLLSGGNVDWETGFTFRVSSAIYTINGILYSSAEQTIVLDAANGANPRIDVIALDTNGTVIKLTGVAAGAPAKPDVDPSLYLELTFVTVPTAATAPPATDTGGGAGSGIVNVYTENAEWAAADFNGASGFSYASAVNPHGGTKCIRTASWTRARGFRLNKGSDATPSSYQSMRLFLQNTNATRWGTGRIQITLRNAAGAQVGGAVTIANGSLGFQDTLNTYQQISIPMSAFKAAASASFRYIQAIWAGSDGKAIAIDDWTLTPSGTTGGGSPPTGGLTQTQADALYLKQASNLADVGNAATARNNLDVYSKAAVDAAIAAGVAGSGPWWFNPPLASSLTLVSGDGTNATLVDDGDVGLLLDAGLPFSGTSSAAWSWRSPTLTPIGRSRSGSRSARSSGTTAASGYGAAITSAARCCL
jgi:hypothetical protein